MEIPRQIYVYSPARTDTVKMLLSKLPAHRLVRFDGLTFLSKGRPVEFEKNDVVICWGVKAPRMMEPRILNAHTTYIDDIALNKQLRSTAIPGVMHHQVGKYASSHDYEQARLLLQKQRIDAFGSGQYVPCSHLYGYYAAWFRYEKAHRVSVVNGKVIHAEWHNYGAKEYTQNPTPDDTLLTSAVAVIQALKLEFGVVYFFQARRGEYYLRRVNTAPTLTQDEADVWVDALLSMLG